MIVLVIILLVIVGGLGYQKFRGVQALTFTSVDISGISLEEIIAIGTKASGSLVGRMVGGTPTAQRVNGGAEWRAQIQGSVMSFRVTPLPAGNGYRVGGVATKMRIAQVTLGSNRGIWGISKALSNAIYAMLGIPHNSPALVRRRKRVLRAVANAGTVIPAAAPVPVSAGTASRPYR